MGKFVITSKGKALQAKVLAGKCKYAFSKIAVGNGTLSSSDDYASRNELVSKKADVTITQVQDSGTECTVKGVMTNSDVSEAFYVREVGLYATDPDEGEILYCAHYYDMPMPIDAASSGSYTKEFTFKIGVESADNVTVTVNTSGIATLGDLDNTKTAIEKEYKSSLIALLPAHYGRSVMWTGSKAAITSPDYLTVNIGNVGYALNGSASININTASNWDDSTYATAANRKGKDFYIYACQPTSGTVPKILLSANSTVPKGYTATNSRKIGGFHCECADVGTISGHPLSGYVAGDILPASMWDLMHRAMSDNAGMVFDGKQWIDIYLASWTGSQLASVYGGVIADGESSVKFHGEIFAEKFAEINKHLPFRDQFLGFAKGSNEMTNIKGSADANTTGGHVDTAGRRMISNIGCEDCCGFMWQWTADTWGHPNNNTNSDGIPGTTAQTSSATGDHWLQGYGWQEDGRGTTNSTIDGAMNKYGLDYGALVRALVGGYWGDGSHCGSRSVGLNSLSSRRDGRHGARGASEPRPVAL